MKNKICKTYVKKYYIFNLICEKFLVIFNISYISQVKRAVDFESGQVNFVKKITKVKYYCKSASNLNF